MKFVDGSQNLRVRLRIIQVLALILLGVLGVRLYMLQVVNGARYAEVAENQRSRLLPIPAPRGVIFDREGNALVDSRPIYSIILSREDTKSIDRNSLVQPLSLGLEIDPQILRERFDQVKSQPAFESILIKEDAAQRDIAWVDAHQLELPALRIEQTPQRRYPPNGSLAHALGYVQEISPEQLEDQRYKDKHSSPATLSVRTGSKLCMTNTCAGEMVIVKSSWTVGAIFKAKSSVLSRNRARILSLPSTATSSKPPRTNCASRRRAAGSSSQWIRTMAKSWRSLLRRASIRICFRSASLPKKAARSIRSYSTILIIRCLIARSRDATRRARPGNR